MKKGTALHDLIKPSCANCPIPNSRNNNGSPMSIIRMTYATRKGMPPLKKVVWGSRYKLPKPAARDIVQRTVSKVVVQVWHDWKEKSEFYFSFRLPEGSFLFPSGKLAAENNNRNRSSLAAISGGFFPISGDCEGNVGWIRYAMRNFCQSNLIFICDKNFWCKNNYFFRG